MRSILSGASPFDRFINGDRDALTSDEQAGLRIFRGKGNCVSCHVGPNFSDERPHNTGVAWTGLALTDAGAGRGDFKTRRCVRSPGLRLTCTTAASATLEQVVEFYDSGGRANPALDPEIRPLRLSADERRQLGSFLRTLSGELQMGATRAAR